MRNFVYVCMCVHVQYVFLCVRMCVCVSTSVRCVRACVRPFVIVYEYFFVFACECQYACVDYGASHNALVGVSTRMVS